MYRHVWAPVLSLFKMALKEVIWDDKFKSWCVWYDRAQANDITKWGKAHSKLLKGLTTACNGAVKQTRSLIWLFLLAHCPLVWHGCAFSKVTGCCILTALDSVIKVLHARQWIAEQDTENLNLAYLEKLSYRDVTAQMIPEASGNL